MAEMKKIMKTSPFFMNSSGLLYGYIFL